MSFDSFAAILISGLIAGAVYAVFALGLSLVYGTSRVMNFAHGSLYMLAAYLAFTVHDSFGFGIVGMALVVLPVMFAVGVAVDWSVIRPLRASPDWKTTTMMASLGLALVIDNALLVVYGPGQKQLPPVFGDGFEIAGIYIAYQDITVFLIAAMTVAGLELFLKYTFVGQAMRAVSQDAQGSKMVGIRSDQIFSYAFGLSTALAGIAALLLAPVTLVSPQGGWPLFLKAFVAVVLGGLGSTRGTLIASMMLGVSEAFVIYSVGANWIMPAWLLILLFVLMVRPKGLLGVWAT